MATEPEAAFALLADETRIDILEALSEAPRESVPFSELRERAGVADSGRFNYHLGKLVGTWVHRTDEGYRLTMAGVQLVGALLAGTYTGDVTIPPFPVGDPCPECGGELVAEYADERATVRCADCEEWTTDAAFPPGTVEQYDRDELPRAFDRWIRGIGVRATLGFCPNCAGRMDPSLVVDESATDGEPTAIRECPRCSDALTADLLFALLFDPDVASFCADRGVDVLRTPTWVVDRRIDRETTVHGDPPRADVTLSLDGATRRYRVGPDLAVDRRDD